MKILLHCLALLHGLLLSGCGFRLSPNLTTLTYTVELQQKDSEKKVTIQPTNGKYQCKPGDTIFITPLAQGPESKGLGFNTLVRDQNDGKKYSLSTMVADGLARVWIKPRSNIHWIIEISPDKHKSHNFVEQIVGDKTFEIIAKEENQHGNPDKKEIYEDYRNEDLPMATVLNDHSNADGASGI